MYLVVADGLPWIDSEGADQWPGAEADALAEVLERNGYDVAVFPA